MEKRDKKVHIQKGLMVSYNLFIGCLSGYLEKSKTASYSLHFGVNEADVLLLLPKLEPLVHHT